MKKLKRGLCRTKASPRRCSLKKGSLKDFTKLKPLCLRLQLYKKDTLVQVFSHKYCEISKNTFFHRTPPVATSGRSIHREMFYKKGVPKIFAKLTGKHLYRSFFFKEKKRLQHKCFTMNFAKKFS